MSEKFQNNRFSVRIGEAETVCDILFRFQSKETGKHYMAFTDHSKDQAGNPSVFYATFDPDADDISLAPIETEQEWRMVREMMQTLQDEALNEMRQKLRQAHENQNEK